MSCILTRKQEGLAQCADDDNPNTTGTLQGAIPSAGDSEDTKISPDSSVSPDACPTVQKSKMESCNVRSEEQHLATMEGNCEIKRQGEGSTSKEEESATLQSIPLKLMGLAGQVSENLSDAQTDPQRLDNPEAKTFQDLSSQATLQAEVSVPGKDSPMLGQSQSIDIVHSSSQTADCSERCFQELEKELSALKLIARANLARSSAKAVKSHRSLGKKKVLEEAPGLNKKTDQPIPMEEARVDVPPQLKPEDPSPPEFYEALASISSGSPQPTSLTEESPPSLVEETAVEGN